jgi:sarcosine oxidase
MVTYDAIVVGLGVAGAASAHQLAREGRRVLALDRFSPPHVHGSSHGGSRIIREAYFEDSGYVPLVRRAYDLWQELERETGDMLLVPTGGVTIGAPDGTLVRGAEHSAVTHAIPHETLSSRDIVRRYPTLRPDADMVGVFEHRAGVLMPEACVRALIGQAAAHGAHVHVDEPVLDWSATSSGVEVRTSRAQYSASALVLAAGPWLPDLLGETRFGLWVERQVMHWFARADNASANDRTPITLWEYEPGGMFYTIPDLGAGTKAAFHHAGERGTADEIRRDVATGEIEAIERIVARFVPGLAPRVLRSATCLYTNTPNQHFLIDRHPDHPRVVIASACSGHGFKFAPAVGELVAGLVTGTIASPPPLFSLARAASSPDQASAQLISPTA